MTSKLINKPHDWLSTIEKAIENKYAIHNVQFTIHNKFVNREDIAEWLKNNVSEPFEYINWLEKPKQRFIFAMLREKPDPSLNRWIKYCHIKENIFELKCFSPNPSIKVCEKIIDNFFKKFYSTVNVAHKKITFTIFGDCTYSEKEMRKELFYLVRTGNPKIEVKSDLLQDEKEFVYTLFAQPDTLENMLKNGYLTLEYFND